MLCWQPCLLTPFESRALLKVTAAYRTTSGRRGSTVLKAQQNDVANSVSCKSCESPQIYMVV